MDVEAERISAERIRLVDDARELARELLALADDAATRFPPDQPDVSAQSHATDQARAAPEASEPEDPEPDLPAESQAVAALWAAAAGHAPEHDLAALLPPDQTGADRSATGEETPWDARSAGDVPDRQS